MIDYLIVGLLVIPFGILVFLLGILTLGLGWLLFGILVPAVALAYIWNTLGGPNQATVGMRMMGIRLERFDGSSIDGLTAVTHSVLFWISVTVLTPLILLATLFLDYKRTLHDLLLGTVVSAQPALSASTFASSCGPFVRRGSWLACGPELICGLAHYAASTPIVLAALAAAILTAMPARAATAPSGRYCGLILSGGSLSRR